MRHWTWTWHGLPCTCTCKPLLCFPFCGQVGEIYALIGDSVSRKALLSSCMAVRSSPSVLAQITMLRIQQEQLYNYSGLCHPLASFPAGASLRTLVVHGSLRHYPRDDGAQLCHLLRPDASVDGPLRTRIEQTLLTLQELCLQVSAFLSCLILSPTSVGLQHSASRRDVS